MNFRPLHEY